MELTDDRERVIAALSGVLRLYSPSCDHLTEVRLCQLCVDARVFCGTCSAVLHDSHPALTLSECAGLMRSHLCGASDVPAWESLPLLGAPSSAPPDFRDRG